MATTSKTLKIGGIFSGNDFKCHYSKILSQKQGSKHSKQNVVLEITLQIFHKGICTSKCIYMAQVCAIWGIIFSLLISTWALIFSWRGFLSVRVSILECSIETWERAFSMAVKEQFERQWKEGFKTTGTALVKEDCHAAFFLGCEWLSGIDKSYGDLFWNESYWEFI